MSYKLAFTWLLDKLMDYKAPVRYWAPEEIQPLLESAGFEVHRHRMIDYLPYPHILYVRHQTLVDAARITPKPWGFPGGLGG